MNYALASESDDPERQRCHGYLAGKFALLATEVNPKRAEAWTLQGMVFEQTGRPLDAVKAYTKALQCELPRTDEGIVWFKFYREVPKAQLEQLHEETTQSRKEATA